MPSSFRLFNAGAVFGPGHAAPRPSVRKRIADIVSLVDGPTTSGGGIDDPEDIFRIVRRFQRKRNLKPDGIVNPGGPTEGALNAFAVANDRGGLRLARAIAPAFADLTKQGLSFTADPRNPEALGMWRDANGRRVDPEQAGKFLRPTGPGVPDLDGKQQLFVERLVGKGGRDTIMAIDRNPDQLITKFKTGAPESSGGDFNDDKGSDRHEGAIGDDRLKPTVSRGSGATSFDPFDGMAGKGNIADDRQTKDQPRSVGVPEHLMELHRDRTEGRTHKEIFGEIRDEDGRILHPGMSSELLEGRIGTELSSVLNRISIADKLPSTGVRDLRREIAANPNLNSGHRRELNRYIGIMRGTVPSDGTRERALSDRELSALEKRREKQATILSRAALVPPLSLPMGILGIGADRHRRLSASERKVRHKK